MQLIYRPQTPAQQHPHTITPMLGGVILVIIGGLFGAGLWVWSGRDWPWEHRRLGIGSLLGLISENRATQVARWRLATTAISLMIIALGVAAIVHA